MKKIMDNGNTGLTRIAGIQGRLRLQNCWLLAIVLSGSMLIFLILTGCTKAYFAAPTAIAITLPPPEVTIDQIVQDYATDVVAADLKYKGKRLMFTSVYVDGIIEHYSHTNWTGAQFFVKLYFTAGSVKFTLRNFELMQGIEEGFILNLVGECQGMTQGYVVVEDCWAQSVAGDLNTRIISYGGY